MDDGEFQWDDAKAASNFAKHGVSFDAARRVFDDPFSYEWENDRQDTRELRFNVIGMVEARLVVTSFTYRGDAIRIISARFAEPFERRWYHEQQREN